MNFPFRKSALIIAISMAAVACGGGGGGGGGSKSKPGAGNNADYQTGVFVDSPVAGIGYRTESLTGDDHVTDAEGRYQFKEGETVTFYIGDLVFPPVPATGIVTPEDIAAANTDSDVTLDIIKTNILQVLQTLDSNGDPSDGIQILSTAAQELRGQAISNLDLTVEEFDDAFEDASELTIVDGDTAKEHFLESQRILLRGSWVFSEGNGKRNVLTILDDSRYVIIHEHDDDGADEGGQKAGSVEIGTYTWNQATGEFTVSDVAETDGWGGLYDDGSSVVGATLRGDQLILAFDDEDGEYTVAFTRVADATNSRIGAWILPEGGNFNVLTFLSSSEYVIVHTNNEEAYMGENVQPQSGEFGTYQIDANGNFRALSASVDTDGPGGLFNREDPSDQDGETLTVLPWGDLRFVDMNEGPFYFARVGGFSIDLQDFDSEGALGTIYTVRAANGFGPNELQGKTFEIAVDFADDSSSIFRFAFGTYNDDEGTVTITEVGDEFEVEASWTINSAGTVVVRFKDEDENFEASIVKLTGTVGSNPKILFSLDSEEEASRWHSVLVEQVD